MTLPQLKVGQVWQCRNQKFSVRVIGEHPEENSMRCDIFEGAVRYERGIWYMVKPKGTCYVQYWAPTVGSLLSIVNLLYDPADTQD